MGLFGGGNSSSSSNTTNNAYDQRSVTDASNGGIVGSGNTVDSSMRYALDNSLTDSSNRSLTTTNSGNTTSTLQSAWTDASTHNLITRDSGNTSNTSTWADNRSTAWTDASTHNLITRDSGNTSSAWSWADNSNRSLNTRNSGNTSTLTNWADSSSRVNSSVNNVTALDGGAIGASFDAIRSTAQTYAAFGIDALNFGSKSLNFAGDTVGGAFNFAKGVQQAGYAAQADAFGGALSKVTEAFGKALSFGQAQQTQAAASVESNTRQVTAAYADAKGRGQYTDLIILAAIGVAALIALRGAK